MDELAGHRLLDKRHDLHAVCWQGLFAVGLIAEYAADRVLGCDDFEALLMAVVTGRVLSYLPTWITGQAVASGHLVTALDDPARRHDDIHLLRALRNPPAKLQVFVQTLLQA